MSAQGGAASSARRRGFGGKLTQPEGAAPAAAGSSSSQGAPSQSNGNSNKSNNKGNRSKGKGKAPNAPHAAPAKAAPAVVEEQPAAAADSAETQDVGDTSLPPEVELCFICAEPVHLYSVPPCDHRTCHICALRLRALYKKVECTFCKAPAESVIFTESPTKAFGEFAPSDLPCKDAKLSIKFTTREAMEETLLLLQFNCPDPKCETACSGWNDLKVHVRRDHAKLLCDLCVRNKKIFAHEHVLHTKASLEAHLGSEHHFCEYCHDYLYSDDELYVHMRDRHEQCHICKARGGELAQTYFRDYNAVERHFKSQHYLCPNQDCLDKKFVVFASEMDFKAHQLAEHGSEMSSRERREALRVDAGFFGTGSESAGAGSSGSGRRGRGGRSGGGRNHGSDADEPAGSYLANRSTIPGAAPAGASRRAQFGGNLSAGAAAAAQSGLSAEKETERRHQLFLAEAFEILKRSEAKVSAFRAAVRGYRAGEMSANDLSSTIHSLTNSEIDDGTSIVNGLVPLLDEEEKRTELLTAWNSLRAERTQFPSLGSDAVGAGAGLGGGSRYASAAQGGSGVAQIRSIKNTHAGSSRVHDFVERAASSGAYANRAGSSRTLASTSNFPALASARAPGGAIVPGSSIHSRTAAPGVSSSHGTTSWSLSSANNRAPTNGAVSMSGSYAAKSNGGASLITPMSISRSSSSSGKPRAQLSGQAFPGLPTNANAQALAEKKRQVLGNSKGRGRTLLTTTPGGGSANGTPLSSGNNSGTSTPNPWGGPTLQDAMNDMSIGRIDGGPLVMSGDADGYYDDGGDEAGAGSAGGKGKGKKKKGTPLLTMGAVQRG